MTAGAEVEAKANGLAVVPFPPASLHFASHRVSPRLFSSPCPRGNQNCFSTMNQMHLVCQEIHNGRWPTFWPAWASATHSETTLTRKLLDFSGHFLVPESCTTPWNRASTDCVAHCNVAQTNTISKTVQEQTVWGHRQVSTSQPACQKHLTWQRATRDTI